MRKLVLIGSILAFSSVAHAESDKPQLFDCMETETFELTAQCIADNISKNEQFRDMQQNLNASAETNGDYAIATMKFHPEKMLIEVIAQRDAMIAANQPKR